jgi:hypothetical protein
VQLVALINVLVDDTIADRPMSAECYQPRVEVSSMLAALAK